MNLIAYTIVDRVKKARPRMESAAQYTLAFARQRPLLAISSVATTVFLLLAVTIAAATNDAPSQNIAESAGEETAGEDNGTSATVLPELVDNASTVMLLGTVLSNKTANIFPRRDGIVEDVLVDIGDTVKKGQVVAVLLSKGVEGESAAAIARKRAEKAQMEAEYNTSLHVADQSVNKAEQEIAEKREALAVAMREQDGMLQRLKLAGTNVEQMQDQIFVTLRSARQTIERLLIGSNARTELDIREQSLLPNLGITQRETRYDILPLFNAMKKLEDAYEKAPEKERKSLMREHLEASQKVFPSMHALVSATGLTPIPLPGRGISMDPAEITAEVHDTQAMVLEAKEDWENALLTERELNANEPELAAKLRGETATARSNEVKLLAEEVKTAEKEVSLIASEQEQMVKIAEQGVNIADAELRMETAQSGNRQILSPFSGIVAKRFIEVGQIVMPSDPVFELTDVPTTLAKKAQAEIQFGLPENLLSAVNVGDTVQFFRQSDEEQMYEAVVTRKSPQVDAETYSIMVQARIPDELNLPHRSSVRVRLMDEERPIFRVPATAVKREEDANYVWLLSPDDQMPMRTAVTVIAEDGEFAEIAGAITVKSQIVLDSPLLFAKDEETSPPMQP